MASMASSITVRKTTSSVSNRSAYAMKPCQAMKTGRNRPPNRANPPREWSTTSSCASSAMATTNTMSKKSSSQLAWRSPIPAAVLSWGGLTHGRDDRGSVRPAGIGALWGRSHCSRKPLTGLTRANAPRWKRDERK
jgi:hypothetical protein